MPVRSLDGMIRKTTRAEKANKGLGFMLFVGTTAAATALVIALVGEGTPTDQQTHPTAQQLADAEGGSVSEFPRLERGAIDNVRYCIENTGVVAAVMMGGNEAITCQVGDESFRLITERRSDTVLESLCAEAGGMVVGVAAAEGEDFNFPACHIDTVG